MTQDPDIGVLTKADLREALRVNRALEVSAQEDVEFREGRIESCRERIRDQETLIRIWEDLAVSAPERLVKIRARIAEQEAKLAGWKDEVRAASTPTSSRESKIEALLKRIAQGDMSAIGEMQKLAKG